VVIPHSTVDLNSLGLLTLRLVVGLVFATHGGDKLFVQGVPGVIGFLDKLGISPPELWAWVLTLSELIGGVALMLGLLTRVAAFVTTATMVVAIGNVLWFRGFFLPGYEFALTLLGASIALALTGPGRYAVDAWLGIEE
jgi:putative oxidoreductase